MTAEDLAFLEASIDHAIEFHLHDGAEFVAIPLFVYSGPDNPDVFALRMMRTPDGGLVPEKDGLSILLADIRSVRRPGRSV